MDDVNACPTKPPNWTGVSDGWITPEPDTTDTTDTTIPATTTATTTTTTRFTPTFILYKSDAPMADDYSGSNANRMKKYVLLVGFVSVLVR